MSFKQTLMPKIIYFMRIKIRVLFAATKSTKFSSEHMIRYGKRCLFQSRVGIVPVLAEITPMQ